MESKVERSPEALDQKKGGEILHIDFMFRISYSAQNQIQLICNQHVNWREIFWLAGLANEFRFAQPLRYFLLGGKSRNGQRWALTRHSEIKTAHRYLAPASQDVLQNSANVAFRPVVG